MNCDRAWPVEEACDEGCWLGPGRWPLKEGCAIWEDVSLSKPPDGRKASEGSFVIVEGGAKAPWPRWPESR